MSLQIDWSEESVTNAIKNSKIRSEALRILNANNHSYYRTLEFYIKKYNINTSHFLTGKEKSQYIGLKLNHKKKELNSHCRLDGKTLKKILVRDYNVIYECSICKLNSWLDKPISLQIDHIDGNPFNNTIENLRLLCPNCHSQTPTFAGKNSKQKKIKVRKQRPSKRPEKEVLENLLFKIPLTKIAKQFNVSDKAINKWCDYYNLNKPLRGYWSKNKV